MLHRDGAYVRLNAKMYHDWQVLAYKNVLDGQLYRKKNSRMRNVLANNRLLSNDELTHDIQEYYDGMIILEVIEHIRLTEKSTHLGVHRRWIY